MMEYKRFVSYLYRYEGEQKERNAGFVRLEVRNRQCRIRIFMNHLPAQEAQTGEAWVFRQRDGKPEPVPLGSFSVSAQAAEACFVTQADNFMDTGLPVMAYCGLAVFLGESEQLYLTSWDDTAVNLAELRRKLGEGEGAGEEAVRRAPEMAPDEELPREGNGDASAEKPAPDEPEIPEKKPEMPEREPDIPAEEPELAATEWEEEAEVELIDLRREEDKTEHFRTLPPERFQVISLTPRAGSAAGAAAETPVPAERLREERENAFPGGPKNPAAGTLLWRKMLRAGVRMLRRYGERRESLRAAEEAESTPQTSENEEKREASPEFWQRLSRQLPHQLLFGPEDGRDFLRLSLQDIGRLPRAYWELGKNPFLLHGYGRGRHLLLMHEKERCYLGVPGENRERDRLAAELAGFTRLMEAKDGFYWMREMKE